MNDFNLDILRVQAHRPWPMPEAAWVMTQTWHDLLFAHWPVDAKALSEKVPSSFPIDLFDGQAWVGVVPFRMTNVAPRLVPALPWISAFPELNVRTYVRAGDKPGVYFFSLDAGNSFAVGTARTLLHLPYYSASMQVERQDDWIQYSSRRSGSGDTPPARFEGRYRPVGPHREALRGSLEYFLTERYCLYAVDHAFRPYRLEIHHPPWPLQAAEAEITINTMAEAAGIRLSAMAPVLHFARRQDTVAWLPAAL